MLLGSTLVSNFKQLAVCVLCPSCTAEVAAHPNHLGLVPSAEEAKQVSVQTVQEITQRMIEHCVCYVEHTSIQLACSSRPDVIQSFLTHGNRIALRVFFN